MTRAQRLKIFLKKSIMTPGIFVVLGVTMNSRQKVYESEAQFFLSATLAQTFNNRSSALTGAAIT